MRRDHGLIIEALEIAFMLLTALMLAYTIRHYIFTITVLRKKNNASLSVHETFEPTVTILIPAHNEEKVVGRLLKRITELTYPRSKMQVIIINDASVDNTGKIEDEYCWSRVFLFHFSCFFYFD